MKKYKKFKKLAKKFRNQVYNETGIDYFHIQLWETMEYKNVQGSVIYSVGDECFHGEIKKYYHDENGERKLWTASYSGKNYKYLKHEFKQLVKDFYAEMEERGIELYL